MKSWTTTPGGTITPGLMTGLDDVKTGTAVGLRAMDSVIEQEQSGDSAKAAAQADPGLDAHLAICILKSTV